jgi:alkaline phosphatase D
MTRGSRLIPSEQTRRQFIYSGAALASLPWLGVNIAQAVAARASFSKDPFQLGIASGDPTPTGAVIWTRLAPEPLAGGGLPPEIYEVQWEVADDEGMQKIVQKGKEYATPALGHSVHVEVKGLEPDRWYFYRFRCGDAETKVGRLRTMPSRDTLAQRLRFAFASCQHYETGLYTAYEHMAKEDLDLIFHLGDYIYEYGAVGGRVRKHNSPEIVSLDDYRNRFALYKTDEHLQAAHRLCPWLVVWDDHEVENNHAGVHSEDLFVSPEEFLLRRANAYQGYYENMPLRRRSMPRGPFMQLYRTISFGRLAEFQMLDTRQYRTDQPNGDGMKPLKGGALDPKGTILGDKQEHWLMRSLIASPAQWNVLAQQVLMAVANRNTAGEPLYSMDKWTGYEVSRARLMDFIATRKILNPVVLTGDIHANWVNDLKVHFKRDDEPTVATEFVGTSISSGGNGSRNLEMEEKVKSLNPFVKFHSAERGYVSCTVTPEQWQANYNAVEYVNRPGAPLVTRQVFVVESGRPGANPIG